MKKVIMYLSAFLPMFWLILIKDYTTILNEAIQGKVCYSDLLNTQLFVVLGVVIFITICTIILMLRNKKLSSDLVVVKKATNRTAEYYLGYFSLFILELFVFSFTEWVDIIVMLLLLFVLGIVYIKNGLFFINPTMNIFRSFIYEVVYDDGYEEKTKILVCADKIKIGDSIKIDVSDYDFSFARRITDESSDKEEN